MKAVLIVILLSTLLSFAVLSGWWSYIETTHARKYLGDTYVLMQKNESLTQRNQDMFRQSNSLLQENKTLLQVSEELIEMNRELTEQVATGDVPFKLMVRPDNGDVIIIINDNLANAHIVSNFCKPWGPYGLPTMTYQ